MSKRARCNVSKGRTEAHKEVASAVLRCPCCCKGEGLLEAVLDGLHFACRFCRQHPNWWDGQQVRLMPVKIYRHKPSGTRNLSKQLPESVVKKLQAEGLAVPIRQLRKLLRRVGTPSMDAKKNVSKSGSTISTLCLLEDKGNRAANGLIILPATS